MYALLTYVGGNNFKLSPKALIQRIESQIDGNCVKRICSQTRQNTAAQEDSQ